MPEKNTHRLAAILFADIAGYTALMQRDEQLALASLQKFREVLEAQVPAHGGQLIQFYGDGCLAAFDSSAAAVACANTMQKRFLSEPRLPVRIGLHSGDVVFRDNNVYGDAVNVASRIESMGVPGSVLLSSSVRNHIRNKPEFRLQALGRFTFKNVDKPMTIYALAQEGFAVPKTREMQGKGKLATQKRPLRWAIPAAVLLLASVLLWRQNNLRTAGASLLPEAIRQERVAVIPFRNNTGVDTLDNFRYLCSDLIAYGLTETDIKTCSPQTVGQYQHLLGVRPNNPEGKVSFYEVTGARYWIEGYFISEGDSLTIKSRLTDSWSGDMVRNFPDVKGHTGEKEQLADRLCRRIMGFWAAREDIEKGKFKSPLYEAYQEYRKIFQASTWIGVNDQNEIKYGRRAFEIDTTFYLAALREMYWQAIAKVPRTDTLMALLNPHYEEMTAFEQTLFNTNKAAYQRDYDTYGRLLEENLERFPQDPFIIEHYSFTLAYRENRPAKAWAIANRIKMDQLEISPEQKFNRIGYLAIYGLGAGHYEEVIDLVNTYPRTEEWLGSYFFLKSTALIRNGQLDALEDLSKEAEAAEKSAHWFEPHYDLAAFCIEAAEEFLLLSQPEMAQKWLNKALEWIEKAPERQMTSYDSLHLAKTYYLLGQYQEAVEWGKSSVALYRENPRTGGANGEYLSILGGAYARLDQKEKAEEIIRLFLQKPSSYATFEQSDYYEAARVCAELGDKERTTDLLRQRKEDTGWSYNPFEGQHDYLLRNLFGYGPFEELVGVRDEGLKD